MSRRDPKSTGVSLFLVATLVLSGLSSMLLFGVPQAAAVTGWSVGTTDLALYGDGDEVRFTASVTYEAADLQNGSCSYFLDKNRNGVFDSGSDPAITVAPQTSGQPTCPARPATGGAATAPIKWTVAGSLVGDTELTGYTIIGRFTPSGGSPMTAFTSPFAIDNKAPNPGSLSETVEAQGTTITNAQLRSSTPPKVGGVPYTVRTGASPDANLEQVELLSCATSTVIATTTDVSSGAEFVGVTAAQLGLTTPSDDGDAKFRVRYTDAVGQTATAPSASTCFGFKVDNKGPSNLAFASGLPANSFHVSDLTLTSGTHFTAPSDPSGMHPTEPVTLTWSPNAPASPSNSLVFPAGTITAGTYTLTLTAKDAFGNPTTAQRAINADNVRPVLNSVEFNDDGACDPLLLAGSTLGISGNPYCEGPYTVKIQVTEAFPAGGAANPTAPTLTSPSVDGPSDGKFTFPNAPTHSRSGNVHTFTYTGVTTSGTSPVTLDVQLFEESALNSLRTTPGLQDPRKNIGFSIAGTPQVNFAPSSANLLVENPPATFSMTRVMPSGTPAACPSGAALGANTFCVPNTSGFTMELFDTGTGNTLATFTDSNNDGVYEASYNPTTSEIRLVNVRVTQGSTVGASQAASSLILDVNDPSVTSYTVYKWVPAPAGNGVWEATTGSSNDIPSDGLYLVQLTYNSFSAREIKFRFVLESDKQKAESEQTYVEYSFVVERDGATAGNVHDNVGETNEVVHLARGVTVKEGAAAARIVDKATGCDTSASSTSRLLWGSGRDCYFLIELARPSATQKTTKLNAETDYVLQPIVVEGTSAKANINSETRKLKPKATTISLQTPTFSPTIPGTSQTTIETGVSTTLSAELSGQGTSSEFANMDVWACLFRPGDPANPNPSVDDPFTAYDAFNSATNDDWDKDPNCELVEHPEHGSGEARAKRMTVVQGEPADENRRRELTFTLPTVERDDNGRAIDQFFLRVMARDKVGNILTRDYTTTGPKVFRVADYDVAAKTIKVPTAPATATATQVFRENAGCFQPLTPGSLTPGGDEQNTVTNPCYRQLDEVPGPTGQYPSIDVPLVVQNRANAEDTVVVTWEHRSGSAAWNVELVDTANTVGPDDDRVASKRLEVDLPAATTPSQPTERRVLARFTPAPDALGGDFQTINVTVFSGDSLATPVASDERFVQAKLIPLRHGALHLGPSLTLEHTLTSTPDEAHAIPVEFANTGNTHERLRVAIDPARTTNGPGGHDLCQFGAAPAGQDADAFILLELRTTAGSTISDRTLWPGQREALSLHVDVGRNVAASGATPFACGLHLERVFASGGHTSMPTEGAPTLRVDVGGTPDVRILQLRGPENNVVDVTGAETTALVSPTATHHDLTLYLENRGDIRVEPSLGTASAPVALLSDRFSLGGEWVGIHRDGHEVSLSTAAQPFDLDVSDDDPTRIKDNTPPTGPDNFNVPRGPWGCLEKDDAGSEPEDVDPRFVCRVTFRFKLPTSGAVIGDETRFRFSWDDPSLGGAPASVDVRLVFEHVGAVNVEAVTNHVIGHAQDTELTYAASLVDEARFDLVNAADVPGTVSMSFVPAAGGAPVPCTAGDGDDSGTDPDTEVSSFSETSQRAFFRLQMRADSTAPAGSCSFAFSETDSRFGVSLPGEGTVAVRLDVNDENETGLWVITPAHIYFNPTPSSITRPSAVTGLSVFEGGTVEANGSQFARLLFDAGSGQTNDGVLLSRGGAGGQLTPFADCTLGGRATATDRPVPGGASWMRFPAAPAPPGGSWPLGTDTAPSPLEVDDPFHGQVLKRVTGTGEVRARHQGDVHLYVWGDTTTGKPVWREGWNQVVFFIEDRQDDPALGKDKTGAIKPTLDLRFVLRATTGTDAKKVTDAYNLVGSGGLPGHDVVSLGQGYFATDIYLPEGMATLTVGNKRMEDHNESTTQPVVEAWAMKLNIPSGRSRGGDDLSGAAYWTLEDLGLADGNGLSLVKDGALLSGSRDTTSTTTTGTNVERTIVHRAIRFLNGPLAPENGAGPPEWITGPGVHDFGLFVMQERDAPTISIPGYDSSGADKEISDTARKHDFVPFTDAKPSLVFQPQNRVGVAAGGTLGLQPALAGPAGLYATVLDLPDMGLDTFRWSTQLTLRAADDTIIQSVSPTIVVDASRQAAVNGIPMPLCINPPSGAVDDEAGDFDEEDFSSRTIVDLRGIPGLLVDRGPFSMTPFVVPAGAGDVSEGVRHDASATFTIRGAGLVVLDTSALPTTGEAGVPLTVRVGASGPVATITALLERDGLDVDEATLVATENGFEGTLTPDATGELTLVVLATDTYGGVTTATQTLTIVEGPPPPNVPPQAAFEGNASIARTLQPITFTDLSLDADGSIVAWLWRFGDGHEATSPDATHAYQDDGIYTVSLRVTDDDGDTDVAEGVVTITNRAPTPDFQPGAATVLTGVGVLMDDRSVDLDGEIVGWAWTFGDGDTANGPNPVHAYADDGVYTVRLEVVDDDGAVRNTTRQVTVLNRAPMASFTAERSFVNTGDTVRFEATSSDQDGTIVGHTWTLGDGTVATGDSVEHVYRTGGALVVQVVAEDDDGALAQATRTIEVVPVVMSGEAIAAVGSLGVTAPPTTVALLPAGPVETVHESTTREEAGASTIGPVELVGARSEVVTDPGTARAAVTLASARVTFGASEHLSELVLEGVSASSRSTCGGANGTAEVARIILDGTLVFSGAVAPPPNTMIGLTGGPTLVLNEQVTDPASDQGLRVTAVRVVLADGTELALAQAASGVGACLQESQGNATAGDQGVRGIVASAPEPERSPPTLPRPTLANTLPRREA